MPVVPDPGVTTDDGAPAVVQPAFAPGTVVAGRYRLESRLGSGGGGTVWRCFDEKLGAIVAFKIVADDVDVERWRREVAMARRIADRHVCRVHDLGETGELRYVTMELVEGTSLRAKCVPDLSADEARALFRQVVAGTAAIHAAGVVHRDLKPENIVVEPGGRAVIVDFGLAKDPGAASPDANATMNLRAAGGGGAAQPSATVTSAGMIVGTPRYMSPEQAVGETVDPRTDVWALGLIGHELLTGVVPALEERGGRRVGELAKWPAVAPVLRRCLSLLPSERFADAHALAAALVEPKRGRSRILIAAVAAVAATLAVAGVKRLVSTDAPAPAAPEKPPIVTKTDGVNIVQITNTDEKQWPMAAPMSVALSPDATRFAYTTASGELRVRAIAGGDAKTWTLPTIERPAYKAGDPPKQEALVTVWAAGWYSDGSIGVLATARNGEWRLYRVREDGTSTLLHTAAQRFPVAIAPTGDHTVIAKHGQALFAVLPNDQLQQITTVGNGEQIVALAFSPDGKRIASARVPGDAKDDVTIQVTSASGDETKVIWRGQTANIIDDLLIWLDDDRIGFAVTDPQTRKSRLLAYDLRTGESTPRTDWTDDYIGIGSAANGSALVLRGTANLSVQVGDKNGWPLQRLHDTATRGRLLAGWTTDNRVVFATGEPGKERIVRASVKEGLEPWPNTTAGVELPDAVVGDDVITHRADKSEVVIERIDAKGVHTELRRVPAMALTTFVRCAGERAAPCVLERIEDNQVSWTKMDPTDGALGKTYHRRPIRERHMRSVALTPDGKTLAIVEGGSEIHLVSTVDDSLRTIQTTDADALQSIAFAANSDLWTSSIGYRGRLFGLAKYGWSENSSRVFDSTMLYLSDRHAALRWFWRPTPSPDGSQLAVVVREFHIEVSRIDGL